MENEQVQKNHIHLGARILVGIVALAGIFLIGVYVGYENRPASKKIVDIVNKESTVPNLQTTDFEPFWRAWQLVKEKYPEAGKTSNEEHLYGAIKGLLASFGDPYTTFFDPEETKNFETQISGEFGGVGMEMAQKDGVLTVVAPLKNTPAYKAGIMAGDKIVKIGDKLSSDMSVDNAVDLIRGEPGTDVSITIIRDGLNTPKEISMTRAKISIPTVDTEKHEEQGVFVIKLYSFSAQSPELFRKALQDFVDSGYDKLVLDLRNNPGGYLEAAVSMASWFLPQGEVVVKEIGKTDKDLVLHKSTGPGIFKNKIKMAILVNRGSASASEILAGALSEHGVATLLGEKTFGKGSVQELMKLTPNTSIKITVAKWYTPKGVSISESGLTPTVLVDQNKDTENDIELKQAIDYVAKK
ncbi:MAG TPA: S41 family peptidase [Candidatus Paceibacterota bacterium]|nr:S41 family peptidase [Candidatus Paceibacterota bacterium]